MTADGAHLMQAVLASLLLGCPGGKDDCSVDGSALLTVVPVVPDSEIEYRVETITVTDCTGRSVSSEFLSDSVELPFLGELDVAVTAAWVASDTAGSPTSVSCSGTTHIFLSAQEANPTVNITLSDCDTDWGTG